MKKSSNKRPLLIPLFPTSFLFYIQEIPIQNSQYKMYKTPIEHQRKLYD